MRRLRVELVGGAPAEAGEEERDLHHLEGQAGAWQITVSLLHPRHAVCAVDPRYGDVLCFAMPRFFSELIGQIFGKLYVQCTSTVEFLGQ